ncbi:MAG: hypothetical protein WB697_08230 [Stellaceae bacterium]
MAQFDKATFAASLRANGITPPPFGHGQCAKFVREALESAGADTTGHPVDAKDWGPTLLHIGFAAITTTPYTPDLGDVVVIQPPKADPVQAGHVAGWDGKNWISDFIQAAMWPGPAYRNEQPAHVFYRYPDQTVATG